MSSAFKIMLSGTQVAVPSGVVLHAISIAVTDSAGIVQTQEVDGVTVLDSTFSNIADGPGMAVVSALDVNGALVGTPFTAKFTAPIQAAPTTFLQTTGATFSPA